MVRLCTEILSTGSQCPQFALRGQPWCRAHADPHQRERNADAREIIARIQYMDIFSIACTLQNTVYELRAKLIPPLHAEAILEAATTRLEQMTRRSGSGAVGLLAAAPSDNSHRNNQLHAAPVK